MHITITVSPSRAGTPVGAILKLLNDQGDVVMGVAGGVPGQPPPPEPPAGEQKQPEQK
jgi:hypothetical protein